MKSTITAVTGKHRTGYQVRYRYLGPNGIARPAVTLPTEEQAQDFADVIDRHGHAAGQRWLAANTDTGLTVEQWCGQYLDNRPNNGTTTAYRGHLRHNVKPHPLGGYALTAVQRDDIRAWVKWLQEVCGDSGKTAQNKISFLSGAFRVAVERGLIPTNPALGIKAERTVKRRKPKALTKAEYRIVRDAMDDHYRPFVDFLVHTGCRFNEACALRPEDIDRDTNTVTFSQSFHRDRGTGKGHHVGTTKTVTSERTISVHQDVLDALVYDEAAQFVFTNTRGEPIRDTTFRTNVWNKRLAKTALPPHRRPTPHDLRHTHASWLIHSRQFDPMEIQRRLGHTSITTTYNLYGHLFRDDDLTAQSKLEKAMFG